MYSMRCAPFVDPIIFLIFLLVINAGFSSLIHEEKKESIKTIDPLVLQEIKVKNACNDTCIENEVCEKTVSGYECLCKSPFAMDDKGYCVKLLSNPSSTIDFRIDGPSILKLPQDSAELKVVVNNSSDLDHYSYYWEVLEGAGSGLADTYVGPTLKLKNLKAGTLRLQVTISNGLITDHRDFVLKIIEEKKPNEPPVAVIRPSSPINVVEGTEVVLDAQGSTDDSGQPLEFEWKLLNGPAVTLPAVSTAILRLTTLVTGNYTFKLTVKDKEGAIDEKEVHVIVSPKRDDPPKANINECGDMSIRSAVDVRLPKEKLLLCANQSSDDYGIESYKWFRVDNYTSQLSVDYSGSSTPVLTLTNLQANEKFGPYVFRLEVTDSNGHKDSTTVNILVNKAVNQPPEADAGGNQTVQLPLKSAVLNGNAKDDGEIKSFFWEQIDGPNQAIFINQNSAKSTVAGLEEGIYRFRLNVTDDGGLSASDDSFVSVIRSKNEPPVARAQNSAVTLPSNIAILSGTSSTDDAGIVRYLWIPHDDVPSCIMFLGDSASSPIAMLSGLIPGTFFFTLKIWDHSNEWNSTTVSLNVSAGTEQLDSLEMYLHQNYSEMTYRFSSKLETRISATLSSQIPETDSVTVNFTKFDIDPRTGYIRVVFYASYVESYNNRVEMREANKRESNLKSLKIIDANRVVRCLRNEATMMKEFQIVSINSLYCFLDCSGHGVCDNYTKQCTCNRYWMPNLFLYLIRGERLDCSWSVLYFIFLSMLLNFIIIWCLFARRKLVEVYGKVDNTRRSMMFRRKRRRRYRRSEGDVEGKVITNGAMNFEAKSSYSLLVASDSSTSDDDLTRRNNSSKIKNGSNDQIIQLREHSVSLDST